MGGLWHITVTMSGPATAADRLRWGLRQLCARDPANLAARFRLDAAELQYWDEGDDPVAVARSAARLWREGRGEAGLPDWDVVGLDVCDTATLRARLATPLTIAAPGSVEEFTGVPG
jgi:hypothetical protein